MKEEINYTNYICDCCGEKSKDESFLTTIHIPVMHVMPSDYQGFNITIVDGTTALFELCPKCIKKMYDCINSTFEVFDMDYAGFEIYFKEEGK